MPFFGDSVGGKLEGDIRRTSWTLWYYLSNPVGRALGCGPKPQASAPRPVKVIWEMAASARVFHIQGLGCDARKNLERHVKARIAIAEAAERTTIRWGRAFSSTSLIYRRYRYRRHSDRRGTTLSDVIMDMSLHGRDYSMSCYDAASAMVATGLAETYGRKDWDRFGRLGSLDKDAKLMVIHRIWNGELPKTDWVTGDWGYFDNATPANGWETGENVIYVGDNRWWGHPAGVQSWPQWQATIARWSQGKGRAVMTTDRWYPCIGLVGCPADR